MVEQFSKEDATRVVRPQVPAERGVARRRAASVPRIVPSGLLAALVACHPGPAAWAAAGWYLLKPPLRQGMTDDDILRHYPQWRSATRQELHEIAPEVMGEWEAPLYRWNHEGSFDTAAQCEAERLRLMKAAIAEEPELRRKYPDGYPTLRATLLRASRCIASDDPRLVGR